MNFKFVYEIDLLKPLQNGFKPFLILVNIYNGEFFLLNKYLNGMLI